MLWSCCEGWGDDPLTLPSRNYLPHLMGEDAELGEDKVCAQGLAWSLAFQPLSRPSMLELSLSERTLQLRGHSSLAGLTQPIGPCVPRPLTLPVGQTELIWSQLHHLGLPNSEQVPLLH